MSVSSSSSLDNLPPEIIIKIVAYLKSFRDRLNFNAVNRALLQAAYQWPDVVQLVIGNVNMLKQFRRLGNLQRLYIHNEVSRFDLSDSRSICKVLGNTVKELGILDDMPRSMVADFVSMPKLRRLSIDFNLLDGNPWLTGVNFKNSAIEDLELDNAEGSFDSFRLFCILHMPSRLQCLELNSLVVDQICCDVLPLSLVTLGTGLGKSGNRGVLGVNFTRLHNLNELVVSCCYRRWEFSIFVDCLKRFIDDFLPDSVMILRLTELRGNDLEYILASQWARDNGTAMEFTGPFPVSRHEFIRSTAGIAVDRKNPLLIQIQHKEQKSEETMELNVNGHLRFLFERTLR